MTKLRLCAFCERPKDPDEGDGICRKCLAQINVISELVVDIEDLAKAKGANTVHELVPKRAGGNRFYLMIRLEVFDDAIIPNKEENNDALATR